MPKKYYFGNYPNSSDYDPNIPIGFNKWDAMECDSEEETEEDIPDENEEIDD